MPEIRNTITADTSGAIKGFKQVEGGLEAIDRQAKKGQASIDEFGKKMHAAFGPLGGYIDKIAGMNTPALAAAAGIGALVTASLAFSKAVANATREAIDYGGKLADMSAKTGIAAESLQKLTHAGRLTGASTEQLSSAVTKMQQSLINGSKGFETLGLSQQKLLAMKPEAAFSEIAAAIKRIEDPAQQAAVAMQIFGKSGAELLPTLKSNLADAALQAEHLGLVLSDDTVSALDAMGDSVDTLGATWDATWRNIGATLAKQPEFIAALNGITEALGAIARGAPAATRAMLGFFAVIDKFVMGGTGQQLLTILRAIAQLNGADPAVKTPVFGPMGAPGGPKLPSTAGIIELATKNTREFEAALKKAANEAERIAKAVAASAASSVDMFRAWRNAIEVEHLLMRSNPLPPVGAGTSGLTDTPGSSLSWAQGQAAWMDKYGAANARWAQQMQGTTKETGKWKVELQQVVQLAAQLASIFADVSGKAAAIGAALGTAAGTVIGGVIGGPAGAAIGGALGGLAGGLIGSLFGRSERREKEKKDLLTQLEDVFAKIQQMLKEFAQKGGSAWSDYVSRALEATDLSAERLTRLANMGVWAFAALRKAGFSFVDAIKIIEAGLDKLRQRAKDSGIELSEAFNRLARTAEWARAHENAIMMAQDLADYIDSLRALGLVTQDILEELAREIQTVFADLGGSIDDLFSEASQRALSVLAPALFRLREEARRLGLTLDDATLALIDAAEKSGFFEGLEDPMKKLNAQMDILIGILAALAKYFGVILPDAVQKYIDALNRIPPPPGPVNDGGGGDGGRNGGGRGECYQECRRSGGTNDECREACASSFGGVIGMASGGIVPATPGGRLVRAGEGGEDEWIIPRSKLGAMGGGNAALLREIRGLRADLRRSEETWPFVMRDLMLQGQ